LRRKNHWLSNPIYMHMDFSPSTRKSCRCSQSKLTSRTNFYNLCNLRQAYLVDHSRLVFCLIMLKSATTIANSCGYRTKSVQRRRLKESPVEVVFEGVEQYFIANFGLRNGQNCVYMQESKSFPLVRCRRFVRSWTSWMWCDRREKW
jgi:hypothetical protein